MSAEAKLFSVPRSDQFNSQQYHICSGLLGTNQVHIWFSMWNKYYKPSSHTCKFNVGSGPIVTSRVGAGQKNALILQSLHLKSFSSQRFIWKAQKKQISNSFHGMSAWVHVWLCENREQISCKTLFVYFLNRICVFRDSVKYLVEILPHNMVSPSSVYFTASQVKIIFPPIW